MNIDVRDIKDKVLENMVLLLKDHSSTAKATRFVIENHFDLKETIKNKDSEIQKLKFKIAEMERISKDDEEFKIALKRFIKG